MEGHKMPEEIEVPTEHLHEHMNEAAEHEGGGGFNMRVALTAAILSVIAAVGAMMAGHAANEALILQIKSSDSWSYYQAKSIKASVLSSKMDILKALAKKPSAEDLQKAAEYKSDMDKVTDDAKGFADESAAEMKTHVTLARSVTFFQIAIALSAIAVLTKKRQLWVGGVALGLIGCFFFVAGLL
jgi:hypothetical protein